jgi:hypothetical protein
MRIHARAFRECALKSVTFCDSSNLTVIDNEAFYSCPLQHFECPPRLVTIGQQAFYGCSQLQRVILAVTLVRIEQEAFSQCTKLRTVGFAGVEVALQAIGNSAFSQCAIVELALPKRFAAGGRARIGRVSPGDVLEDLTDPNVQGAFIPNSFAGHTRITMQWIGN